MRKKHLWQQKLSLREIGRRLHRSHTTLSRELQRNREYAKLYMPCVAQYYAEQRVQQQRSLARLKSQVIYDYVIEHLKLRWSPETIAGRLSLDHSGLSIHHESIYRFIYWDNGRGLHLWRYLPLARKKRMRKFGRKVIHSKTIPDGISIDHRPDEVQKRNIVGHWETDNVIGKHSDITALSTTVERVTRYTILARLKKKQLKRKVTQ